MLPPVDADGSKKHGEHRDIRDNRRKPRDSPCPAVQIPEP